MVENSSEFNMIEQNHANSVDHENFTNEDQKTTSTTNFCEQLYAAILDDLIDDSILALCFEAHRNERFIVPESQPIFTESRLKDQPPVLCYVCFGKIGGEKFSSHLADCLGINKTKRKAREKITSLKESESDCDSTDSDRPTSSKKKTKRGNNNRSRQPRYQGNSLSKQSSESTVNYKDMTQDEMRAFFNQHCGSILKKNKGLCRMPPNCSRHPHEDKVYVRSCLLSDVNDQNSDNEELIDVDGIDEDMDSKPFFSTVLNLPQE